jgi:hypothetical protein
LPKTRDEMENQDENNTHEKKKGDQTNFDADCHGSFTLNLPYLHLLQCCWLLVFSKSKPCGNEKREIL